MFQKVHGKRIAPISSGKVVACYEANEDLMEMVRGVHEKFLDRITGIQIAEQPHVMKFVAETLVEAEEEDEDLEELTEEDKGSLFLVLKTEKAGSPH
jgi:hypothetical protein